jgi:hypothetical protein
VSFATEVGGVQVGWWGWVWGYGWAVDVEVGGWVWYDLGMGLDIRVGEWCESLCGLCWVAAAQGSPHKRSLDFCSTQKLW